MNDVDRLDRLERKLKSKIRENSDHMADNAIQLTRNDEAMKLRVGQLEDEVGTANRDASDRMDKLEYAQHVIRRAVLEMLDGEVEAARELLDELEESDPIRAPLGDPPISYTDFFADYRRAQTEEGDA